MIADRIDELEQTRQHLELSITDLWWQYFALGGMSNQLEVEGYLFRALVIDDRDYDLIAVALNERSSEIGEGYPIPYTTDKPTSPSKGEAST